MEERELLICNSNMFVPYVMTECLKNKNKRYIVASDTPNINQFFELLNFDNVIQLAYSTGKVSVIYKEKKKMKSFLANYSITKVIFYHAEFGELANWLLLKFAQKGVNIEYHKVFDSIPVPKAKWYQGLKIKLKQWLCFNYFPDVLDDGTNLFPSLPNSFFKRLKAVSIESKIDRALIYNAAKGLNDKLNIKGNVLLVSGSVVADNLVSKEDYENIINEIIDFVGTENATIKMHPRFDDMIGKEQELNEMPKYIPGNVIIDAFDIYIGYYSTLLVEAAQNGKKVISTLYLMKPQNEASQQRFYEYLENRLNGKGIIYFPKNLRELFDMLSKYNNKVLQ